ncbi:thiamine pyrophosphate-binding protein [Campylobacter sputorum]|uniref:thiamine pyrophosphate-binding protein n=2 Tax=Campylobacter sputorum TaxID=206 RepID=UPI000B77307A|nr:thiamine pyrophosphate-binding protein [Campylobacter sputorum]
MYYTDERNVQIVIELMKEYGVKKIVASPGTTNITFVGSIQQDPYFEIYSSVDERSAAYIACGLAVESGEPVALSCTGATASRNYFPGLTEAYYRNIPILAITSTQSVYKVSSYEPQVIDRSILPKDVAKISVHLPVINTADDEWYCTVQANKAMMAFADSYQGPIHINLETSYSRNFSIKEILPVRKIKKISIHDAPPSIKDGKIGIYVGSHFKWSDELIQAVETFCEIYDAAVFCDHTSNYTGKFKVLVPLISNQVNSLDKILKVDTLIHIGNVSGAYFSISSNNLWRVHPDGEIRDLYRNTHYIFAMREIDFFEKYINLKEAVNYKSQYAVSLQNDYKDILSKIPEIPFSNIWIAQQTADKLPKNSVIHFGILNSLRAWNFFEIDNSIVCYSNTGGFGIDGCVSSLIGASLYDSSKIYFGIVGDLAFFYDMNSIGNRHTGKNIRLMIINNGCGTEFKNYNHLAAKFEKEGDKYMAARGHFCHKSKNLIKNYAENLGFKYISASNKKEYLEKVNIFLDSGINDKSIIFEVFTDSKAESDALKIIHNIKNTFGVSTAKSLIKSTLGEKGFNKIKNFIK